MSEPNREDAVRFITERLVEQGEYEFMQEATFKQMVDELSLIDEKYMAESGVDDGEAYDDEVAFQRMFTGISGKFPQYKMYCMRLTEDYMDMYEEYLESIGAIEWE